MGPRKAHRPHQGKGNPILESGGHRAGKVRPVGCWAVEERLGQREALSQEVTKLKSELHLASVSPAIIIMRGPSWRARG